MVISNTTIRRTQQLAEAARVYKTHSDYSSIRKTAACFDLVSKSALADKLKNGADKVAEVQRRQRLSEAEQRYLFEIADRQASHNFSVTEQIFLDWANNIYKRKTENQEACLGKNWLYRHFQKWRQQYQTVYSKRLQYGRAAANNDKEFYSDYFNILKEALEEYEIEGQNFYNLDEKGFRMGEARNCKVIVRRGYPELAEVIEDGNKENITVLESIAADGWVTRRPLVIYKGKNHNYGWSIMNGYMYGHSESGWIDSDLYSAWIKEIFNPETARRANGRWRLLLVDGLQAHMTLDTIEFCWQNKIIVLCLPSHATHLLQPLDVGVFRHYQHYYSKEVDLHSRHGRTGIGKHNFMSFLDPARRTTFDIPQHESRSETEQAEWTSLLAIRAFEQAGAWPWNPEAARRRIPDPPPKLFSPPPEYPVPLDDDYNRACRLLKNDPGPQEVATFDKDFLLNLVERQQVLIQKQRTELAAIEYSLEKTQGELRRIRGAKVDKRKVFTKARLCSGEYLAQQKKKRDEGKEPGKQTASSRKRRQCI